VASIRLLAPWKAPDTPALGRTKSEKKVGENRHRSEAVLAADGGSTGEWIGMRMTPVAEYRS
jgi:hypothetical protein